MLLSKRGEPREGPILRSLKSRPLGLKIRPDMANGVASRLGTWNTSPRLSLVIINIAIQGATGCKF